jgi:hypothetical protein
MFFSAAIADAPICPFYGVFDGVPALAKVISGGETALPLARAGMTASVTPRWLKRRIVMGLTSVCVASILVGCPKGP